MVSRFWKNPVACKLRRRQSPTAIVLIFLEVEMSDPVRVDPMVARVEANPKYHELRKKRNSFGWSMTALMMVVYYGYIALIAFNKPFLAQPIGSGVTSLGIPIAIGVIIFTIVITGIYVSRANGEYDRLTAEILKEAAK